jgi:predicted secreted acid phosphatase
MVRVDASNPFVRHQVGTWLKGHEQALASIRAQLPQWAEDGREAEKRAARAEKRVPRPLAVVYDIDEVLLCNIHLNGYRDPAAGVDFHVADFFYDPVARAAWGRDDPCTPPLPGALQLLELTVALGLRPFFVTGRLETIRACTLEEFRRARFVRSPEQPQQGPLRPGDLETGLIMCPPECAPGPGESIWPWKEKKRAEIEASHRIILNVGDQASDLGARGDRQLLLGHSFYHTP